MKFFKKIASIIAVTALACVCAAGAQAPAAPNAEPGPGFGPGSGPGFAPGAGPGFGPGPGPGFRTHHGPLERALGPAPGGRFWNDPAMVEKLGLSEDQRKSMDQILQQHLEQLVDMHAAVEKAELGMQPLMSADQPNEQQILAQIDKIAQARVELEKANARFLLAIRAKLSPDQWKQLRAAREERREFHRNAPGPEGARRRHITPPGSPEAAPDGGLQPPPPPGPAPQRMLSQPPAPDQELDAPEDRDIGTIQ